MTTVLSGGLVKMVTDYLSECIQVPQPESPPCQTLQLLIFFLI